MPFQDKIPEVLLPPLLQIESRIGLLEIFSENQKQFEKAAKEPEISVAEALPCPPGVSAALWAKVQGKEKENEGPIDPDAVRISRLPKMATLLYS